MVNRYTLCLALSIFSMGVFAQGDTCSNALAVTSGFYHADGPTTGWAGPSGCGAGGSNGDWYVYIPSFTGTINITSCNALNNNTDDDTYVKVYTGSCGALTCMGSSDDMGQNNCPGYFFASYLDVPVTAGQSYYIVWSDMFDHDDFYWNLSECYATVMGSTFNDANANGVKDSSEYQTNVVLEVNPGNRYVYSGQDPYSFCSDSGSFTITVPNLPLYHTAVPTSQSYSATALGTLVTGMDFAFQGIPGMYDGVANIWGWNPWIGNNASYHVTYGNVGTETLDGSIIVTLGALTSFVSSAPPPDLISGQVLTWNVVGLQPGANGSIHITYHTDSTALTTDTVTATVAFNTNHVDQTPADNEDAITGHPTTSFDPNEKLVNTTTITPDEIALGEELEYTIHFQNTGTQPAVNVIVRDMIDPDLDLSSFVMVGATHANNVQFIGNEVVWTFPQIMLPDSGSDLLGSQGGVHFRIRPKASATPGTLLENHADIYFDYNLPVLTNTVVTEVTIAAGAQELATANGAVVYPSPGDGHMHLLWSHPSTRNARLQVIDMTGRTLVDRSGLALHEGASMPLDLSGLSDGDYLLRVLTDGSTVTVKAVVRH